MSIIKGETSEFASLLNLVLPGFPSLDYVQTLESDKHGSPHQPFHQKHYCQSGVLEPKQSRSYSCLCSAGSKLLAFQ